MKTRIIALVLVVVMSLLALSSCGTYNFAKETLDYATFDFEGFKAALNQIVIEDGDFTTNTTTREKLVKSKIYNAVADKIVAATKEEDRNDSEKIGEGDVLYFVFYAVDEKTNNVYFMSEMKESSLSSTKIDHVIKLGETNQTKDFLNLFKENYVKDAVLSEYAYSMALKADLENKAVEELLEENSEATKEEQTAAKEAAVKVAYGDTIVISYSRSYTKPAEGDTPETPVTESAVFHMYTLVEGDALSDAIVGAKKNNVGEVVEVDAATEEKPDATAKEFKVTINETEYTYKSVKIEWKVEKAGKEIATFKHTPYTKDENVLPDNLREGSDKVNLKDVELTYHVFPVYAISAPVYEDITATDILVHVNGSKITADTFEIFSDESYVTADGKKITDLVAEIVKIFDTKSDKYADGTELKTLLDAYNKASSSSNTAEKTALENAQKAAAKVYIDQIVTATNGTDVAETVILDKYYKNNFHTMKESYDTEIQEKVQEEVWKLIDKYVTVNEDAIPEKLIKEFADALYESYEYDYYTGKYNNSSTVTNYDQFSENGGLDAFLNYKLKTNNSDEVKAALNKQAKEQIVSIIKIFVVSKAYADVASAEMPAYIEHLKEMDMYEVDEQSYIDYYGEDKYEKHYKTAVKNAEKQYKYDYKQAGLFLVNDAYLRNYKRQVGAATYRQEIKDYGKTNLRVAFQFDNLFQYLTGINYVMSDDGDHAEANYATRDGVDYIDFRNVTYTIKAEETN